MLSAIRKLLTGCILIRVSVNVCVDVYYGLMELFIIIYLNT